MSLGHWCFVFTVTCSLVFGTTELKHVTVQSFVFWTEEASNWSIWRLFEFTERFFQAITARITVHCRALLHDHCRALWQLRLPQLLEGLSSTQPVTDRGLTDFPLGRFNQLVANTLRVPALGYESVSATEMLAPTLPEFEAAEINDLLLVTQAVTAVRTHLWDTEEHCTEPRMASFNCRAWQYDGWTVWNSLRNS